MKKFTKFYLFPLLTALCLSVAGMLTGCSNEEDSSPSAVVPVTVKLETGDITESGISVTATPSDASGEYVVSCLPTADIESLTEEQLVSKITSASDFKSTLKKGTKKLTFNGLNAETSYTLVAFGWADEKAGTVYKVTVSTTKKPVEATLSKFFDIDYWGDTWNTNAENFIIRLGDCNHEGINPKGNGRIYNFSIFNSTLADADNPLPKMGTYVYGKAGESTDMTIETSESLLMTVSDYTSETDFKITKGYYTDARLTISALGDDNYKIEAYVKMDNGEEVNLEYSGKITFRDKSFKGYTGPQLEKNLDYTSKYVENYNHEGTSFRIIDEDPYETGWYNHNQITIYLPAESTESLTPPVGTFKVKDGTGDGVITPGEYVNYGGGSSGQQGTCYSYIDQSTMDITFGFVVGGTVTVSKNAQNGDYTIVIDFTTSKGHKIKTTYTGPFPTSK